MVKNLLTNGGDRRDAGSIPGSAGSPGEAHGNLLQSSCLENPRDRGAWRLQSIQSQASDITEATWRAYIYGEEIFNRALYLHQLEFLDSKGMPKHNNHHSELLFF